MARVVAMDDHTIEERIETIRQWLRHNPGVSVELHLLTLYATMGVEIREWPEGTLIHSDYGMNFGKRLDFVIEKLGIEQRVRDRV